MSTTTPTDARTVELYQVQGGVAAPLQVRCTCEKPDATDIEALIAAAIAAHNTDPNAHPDIRKAIEDAAGSGGGLVTTPVLTLAERLPIGAVATLGMTATAGLNGAHVQSFSVTIGDAEPVIVEAADNAAEYAFTPNGNEGDMVSVSVVATDNFGNRSKPATAQGTLETQVRPMYCFNGGALRRSLDNGMTWTVVTSSLGSSTNEWTGIYRDKPIFIRYVRTGSSLSVYIRSNLGETAQGSLNYPYSTMACNGAVQADDGTIFVAGAFKHAGSSDSYVAGFATYNPESNSWSFITPPLSVSAIHSLFKTRTGTLLAGCSTSGAYRILRSTDNGKSWTNSASQKQPLYFYMTADGSSIYVASDTNTPFALSTNDGVSWPQVPSSDVPALTELFSQVVEDDTGTLHAVRYRTYVRSADGGLTWNQPATAPGIPLYGNAAAFAIGPVTYSTSGA